MFKTLEKDGKGKIELDMQQVCEKITKAAAGLALLVQIAYCIILFPLTVAVPGDLLTVETTQARDLL